MILGKVRIQKFKSIKDTGWVHLSKGDLINILAGQNESGKTSFLRALRFFEEGIYSTFEEQDRKNKEEPRVDCTFCLTDTERKQLQQDTNLEIADYIEKNGFTFIRQLKDGNFEKSYAYPDDFKKIVADYNAAQVVDAANPDAPKKEVFDPYTYFDAIKPQMVLYSSFMDNNLPGTVSKSDVDTNQAVIDFQTVYKIKFADLMSSSSSDKDRRGQEERVREAAALSLNKYWRQIISGEKVQYRYVISINFQEANPQASTVNFYINQGDGDQLSISQKSQGFQWFAGFNLRLRAHEVQLDKKGLILLIDEPGQGLHEVAQQDVKNVIEELAKKANIQIIYSTHQPILLGKENIDFSRLLLVDRDTEKGSMFKTVSALVSSNGSLDSLAPIRSALGMVTLTDPLVDKKTLIVEGITEYFIIKTIVGSEYVIVPSTGVDQIPNIFSILYAWGVPAKALVDDDSQGKKVYEEFKKEFFNNCGSDDELKEFETKVLKVKNHSGIEELISESIITSILSKFGKTYDSQKTKIENVKQVGKYIFAKSFHDEFNNKTDKLDSETLTNFKEIIDFLKR